MSMASENKHTHPNYSSGDDYILEFRSFRYGFNSVDFSQRVEMAAVELGLVEPGVLQPDERADLVQLVASGAIEYPVSSLGEYLLQRGDEVLTLHGECLVHWLRELVFRSAWLDLRLMEGQLEVAFDDETGTFEYFPTGHRTRKIGPPPHPSWHEVAYNR
jgi:hypothetical protein